MHKQAIPEGEENEHCPGETILLVIDSFGLSFIAHVKCIWLCQLFSLLYWALLSLIIVGVAYQTALCGWGVVAAESISQGDFIIEYIGEGKYLLTWKMISKSLLIWERISLYF